MLPQMALAPHTHEVPPPQLTKLLVWLTGGVPAEGGSRKQEAVGGGLPAWLPEVALACPALEEPGPSASSALDPG